MVQPVNGQHHVICSWFSEPSDDMITLPSFHRSYLTMCKHKNTKKIIKKYYWKKPNVFKFAQLLSVHNTHDLCNLGKYVHFAFKSRECILS